MKKVVLISLLFIILLVGCKNNEHWVNIPENENDWPYYKNDTNELVDMEMVINE